MTLPPRDARPQTHRGSERIWCLMAARHNNTSIPTRGAPAGWRMHRLDGEAAPRDQPGNHRVRVPHLACPELVASPDRSGYVVHQLKETPRNIWVVCQPLRAADGLVNVRNHSITPTSDLVPKDAQRASPAAADCAFGDDAAQLPVSVRYRCLFDHKLSLWHSNHERGVVKVLGRSLLEPRHDRLENPSVQPYGMTAGPQRKPEEINARWHFTGHDACPQAPAREPAAPTRRAGSRSPIRCRTRRSPSQASRRRRSSTVRRRSTSRAT
jgi:hypothetical protein